MKPSIYSFSEKQLTDWLAEKGEKPYRARQILHWIYQKKILQFELMTNLSLSLKTLLCQNFTFPLLKLVQIQDSLDQETTKFLFKLPDGQLIESVLICSSQRRTVCVSSQVGCPARCAFCASGQQGLMRDLTAGEIIEQILHIDAWLLKREEKVSHIVYMGMGEPLKNFEAVLSSIHLLTDPHCLNLSKRRITVSTVGVIEGIYRLAKEEVKVNLVLSLHAPNQKIRQKIIPYSRLYPLEEILKAMDFYAETTKRDITFEYTLISGINDQKEHARELASLLRGKQCTVNLIPYNPIPKIKLQKPNRETIEAFRKELSLGKIVHTCRYTKGDDIAAACGQLALKQAENTL